SPLLVLWSRIGRFDPALVEGLLASRDLFETASLIVPMSDLPIHSATMRAYRAATSGQPTRFTRGSLEGAGGGTWPERAAAMLALRALGVATRTQLRRHHAFGTQVTRAALDELEGKGLVRRVTIADGARAWSGTWYAPGDVVEQLASVHRSWEERTTLLSPFDNLIADRAR